MRIIIPQGTQEAVRLVATRAGNKTIHTLDHSKSKGNQTKLVGFDFKIGQYSSLSWKERNPNLNSLCC